MNNDDKKNMPKAQKGMLSFAVTSTSQGQQVIYSINESIGEIKSFAEGSDDRNFYKHLSFKDGKDQVVICISHANEGCFLRILRYIPGRSGDNQEAWIYIPANLVVPSDMLNQVIAVVRDAIIDTKLTEHTSRLEDVFQREYTIRDVHPMVKKSSQGKIAYRIIPKEGLQSLFGDKLFEPYYYDFEKTLFVNNEYLSVLDTYEDISSNGFTKWVAITRSALEPDVLIKVDGTSLSVGMMVDSQKKHTIEYIKADYLEPIKKNNIKFSTDTQLPDGKLDFEYELKGTMFKIIDEETGEDITEKSDVRVDKCSLGEGLLLPVNALRDAKLTLSVKCYQYIDCNCPLKISVPTEHRIIVKLKHKTDVYKFKIRSEHLRGAKNDAEFQLELREKPKISPLKNYILSERANNIFNLRPLTVIKPNWMFLLSVLFGALIFVAVGLGLGYYLWGTQSSSVVTVSNDDVTVENTDTLTLQTNGSNNSVTEENNSSDGNSNNSQNNEKSEQRGQNSNADNSNNQ